MATDPSEWAAPLPRARADRLRALAPVVLLLIVAALGIYRSITLDQSSWRGASFGMFATYDGPSRSVQVTATGPDGSYRIRLPEHLRDEEALVRAIPTDGNAAALAREVLALLEPDAATSVQVVVTRFVLVDDPGPRIRLATLAVGAAG